MKTHKKCTACQQTLPIDAFGIQRQGKTGPIYQPRCKPCDAAAVKRKWHELTPEQKRKRSEGSKYFGDKQWHKNYRLLTKYNITLQQFEEMYAAQQGKCKICHVDIKAWSDNPKDVMLARVDHCHATGKVRSLLCHQCNTALGLLNDCPSRMNACIEYVKHHDLLHQASLA